VFPRQSLPRVDLVSLQFPEYQISKAPPSSASPHRVGESNQNCVLSGATISPAGVFFICILHVVIIASSNRVAFLFNMEHYAIEKFKHMHSCVNPIRPYPRQRRIISFNISTARLLQLLLTAFRIVYSPQRFISSPDGDRGLFPHPMVTESLFLFSETPSK